MHVVKVDGSCFAVLCLLVLGVGNVDSAAANRNMTENSLFSQNTQSNIQDSTVQEQTNRTVKNDHSIPNKRYETATFNATANPSLSSFKHTTYKHLNLTNLPLLRKIHSTLTRSKDAVWATISLTFMCVVLLLAVAQSQMWKENRRTDSHGIPLPNFNERVPFKEVMERKVSILKELLSKGKKKRKKESDETELESLLVASEYE